MTFATASRWGSGALAANVVTSAFGDDELIDLKGRWLRPAWSTWLQVTIWREGPPNAPEPEFFILKRVHARTAQCIQRRLLAPCQRSRSSDSLQRMTFRPSNFLSATPCPVAPVSLALLLLRPRSHEP